MAIPSSERVQQLLAAYLQAPLEQTELAQVQQYLERFEHWSVRTNLSAITDSEQVVQRHFGEGFVLARSLPPFQSLLDLGSGAGFPGIPVSVLFPHARILLAESQQKKAAFLREAVWKMGINVSVWADRAEKLQKNQQFDVVALRAVDGMSRMLALGRTLLRPSGCLVFFVGEREEHRLPGDGWAEERQMEVPNSRGKLIVAQLAS